MFFCNTLIGSDYNTVTSSDISAEYAVNDGNRRCIDYPAVNFYNDLFYFMEYSGEMFSTADGKTFTFLYDIYDLANSAQITTTAVLNNEVCYFGKNNFGKVYICGKDANTLNTIGNYDGGRLTQAIYTDKYLVVGYDGNNNGTIRTSNDFSTWSEPTVINSAINTVCFNDNFYIFGCENGNVYTSLDGVNLSGAISTPATNIRKIIYTLNQYVAIGEHDIIVSANGSNWVKVKSFNSYSLVDIAYYEHKFVIVAANGTSTVVISTLDLKKYTETTFNGRSTYSTTIYPNNRVAAGNGRFVIGFKGTTGDEQSGSRYMIWSI